MTAEAERRVTAERFGRAAWQRALACLFVALVVPLAGVGAWHLTQGLREPEREFERKGEVELLVYARKDQHTVLLDRFNRIVHPGEELRFILTGVPDDHSHVLVASVDGAGAATIHFPYEAAQSARVPGPGRWEVPGSIALDETLGPERVFALFSKRPLAATEVKQALLRLGRAGDNAIRDAKSLDIPDTTQRSFLLLKRPRPSG